MAEFFVTHSHFEPNRPLADGDDPEPGWRIEWLDLATGLVWLLGYRFRREKDAKAAAAALKANGYTPEMISPMEDDDPRWPEIKRICMEALQW